jgi:hypothetical protein
VSLNLKLNVKAPSLVTGMSPSTATGLGTELALALRKSKGRNRTLKLPNIPDAAAVFFICPEMPTLIGTTMVAMHSPDPARCDVRPYDLPRSDCRGEIMVPPAGKSGT